jgi:hypothetical protein
MTRTIELMEMISDRQSTPRPQAVLNDEQPLQPVLSGDTRVMQQEPPIRQRLADPSLQGITRKVVGE